MSLRRGLVGRAIAAVLVVVAVGLGVVPADPAVGASTIESFYASRGAWAVSSATIADDVGRIYRLFYPTGLGADGFDHPVVTWGNGTFASPANYLGVLNQLASWGFVVVAFTGDTPKTGEEMLAGAEWVVDADSDPSSIFFHRIDTTEVGAAGHSQGAGGAINATIDSDGLISTTLPVALTRPLLIDPAGQFDITELTDPVLLLGGNLDLLISPPGVLVNYYNLVPGPAALAVLKGAGHLTIQNSGGRFLGYLTAWMMYQLQDDGYARGAFVGNPPEINTNTAWQNQAQKNLP